MAGQRRTGWICGLAAAAAVVLALGASRGRAAPLLVGAGDAITIDTDALTITGDASAAGSLLGGAATFVFDTISLGTGSTVNLQGSRPLELLSMTNLSIDTTLDASGGHGVPNTSVSGEAGFGGLGLLGGAAGGRAGQGAGIDGTDGQGPGGGAGQTDCCGGGGGGGYGGAGGDAVFPAPGGGTYGTLSVAQLLAGSGGGGGAGDNNCCFAGGGGGGAGGGAVSVLALGDVHLGSSAELLANGGNGAGTANVIRSGGGGSGGAIRLGGDNVTLDPGAVVSANGGDAPFSAATQKRGGGGGGGGRVAIFSDSSLTNNGTVTVGGGAALDTGDPGTVYIGGNDGSVNTLDLGTGSYHLIINTDSPALCYVGDTMGSATGSVENGVATFQFDQIALGPGVDVLVVGDRPLSLVSAGDITLATTLDASGGDGVPNTGTSGEAGFGGGGILGGGDGGRAGQGSGIDGTPGEGPGGGGGQRLCCGGGSGGGYGGEGGMPRVDTAHATPAGPVYGDPLLLDLLGGSGGGGGAGDNDCCYAQGGGGGAGGGAIELVSETGRIIITADGEILVDGGDGAGNSPNYRSGGGGSGGGIRLEALLGIDLAAGSLLSAQGGISHLSGIRSGGGGGGGRIALLAQEVYYDGVRLSAGLLDSTDFMTVLGGPGAPSPGGTAGDPGTIFVSPEPATIGLLALGALALLRRRRTSR